MKTQILPDALLSKMSKADRMKLGKAGKTAAECQENIEAKCERDLQKMIASLLRIRDIYYEWSRTDRKTTTTRGDFDFRIVLKGGRHIGCEVKIGRGKLSEHQIKRHQEYELKTGCKPWVVYSLTEFKDKLYRAERGDFN